MEVNVDVNADTGISHWLETITAKTHNNQIREELLRGKETSVKADKGYVHAGREVAYTKDGDTVQGVMRKALKAVSWIELDEQINRIIAGDG